MPEQFAETEQRTCPTTSLLNEKIHETTKIQLRQEFLKDNYCKDQFTFGLLEAPFMPWKDFTIYLAKELDLDISDIIAGYNIAIKHVDTSKDIADFQEIGVNYSNISLSYPDILTYKNIEVLTALKNAGFNFSEIAYKLNNVDHSSSLGSYTHTSFMESSFHRNISKYLKASIVSNETLKPEDSEDLQIIKFFLNEGINFDLNPENVSIIPNGLFGNSGCGGNNAQPPYDLVTLPTGYGYFPCTISYETLTENLKLIVNNALDYLKGDSEL